METVIITVTFLFMLLLFFNNQLDSMSFFIYIICFSFTLTFNCLNKYHDYLNKQIDNAYDLFGVWLDNDLFDALDKYNNYSLFEPIRKKKYVNFLKKQLVFHKGI